MSLVDLFTRQDSRCRFGKQVRLGHRNVDGQLWVGLEFNPSDDPVFVLHDLFSLQPFREGSLDPSWTIQVDGVRTLRRRIGGMIRGRTWNPFGRFQLRLAVDGKDLAGIRA